MRVLLIVAPFGLIEYPNLAVSLLKAELVAAGFACDLHYASLDFARRIGFDPYRTICTMDAQLLIPERIFAQALFGSLIPPWNEYWQNVILPYERPMNDRMRNMSGHQRAARTIEGLEQHALQYVEEFTARPELSGYDLFGFSTSYAQNCASLSLAKRLKERCPHIPIIFGGANCAGGMGETMLKLFPFIDYVCVEDGDISFPQFVSQLAGGAPITVPGILQRGDDSAVAAPPAVPPAMVTDLDALPLPDFSDFFRAFDFRADDLAEVVAIPMETSRGCWWGQRHHCVFCGLNRDSMGYRVKSAQRVDAEIRTLVRRYGVKKIMMTDNIMNHTFVSDTLPVLAQDPEHQQIFFEVKANLTKNNLRLLKTARIDHLQPGIESLSTHVLKLMDKGIDALQNLQLLRWAKELHIRIAWNVLCGFPGETPDDYDAMAALIPKIHHLQPPLAFSQITIDRFSPLFTNSARFGITIQPNRSYHYVYPFSDEVLRALAYWFSQTGPELNAAQTLAPPAYARGAFQAYLIWRRIHSRVEFSYRYAEPSHIVVTDTRAVAAEEQRTLDDLETAVFESLDGRQSFASLMRHLADVVEPVPAEAAVRSVLPRFRQWNYLHEEGERMIVLANRQPTPAALDARFDLRTALPSERGLAAPDREGCA